MTEEQLMLLEYTDLIASVEYVKKQINIKYGQLDTCPSELLEYHSYLKNKLKGFKLNYISDEHDEMMSKIVGSPTFDVITKVKTIINLNPCEV